MRLAIPSLLLLFALPSPPTSEAHHQARSIRTDDHAEAGT